MKTTLIHTSSGDSGTDGSGGSTSTPPLDFANILQYFADAITVQSPDGDVVYANEAAAYLSEFPSAQAFLNALPEQRFQNLTVNDAHGNPFPMNELPGRKLMRGEPESEVVLRVESRTSGKIYWRRVRAFPIVGVDGALQWIVNIFYDVTGQYEVEREREQLLSRLAAERGLLESVLQQMPAGVIIAEAPSGRLILGNEQVAQIWRHPFLAADTVGEYIQYKGFHPDGKLYEPHEWPLARTVATGEVVIAEEIVFERGDGTRGVMQVSSAPIYGAAGDIVAGVVTFTDITSRKETEEQIRSLLLREQEARAAAEKAQLRLAFIAEASATLSASLDYEATLSAVVDLTVPRLADYCTLHLMREDNTLELVAVSHVNQEKAALIRAMSERYPPDQHKEGNYATLVMRGETLLVEQVPATMLDQMAYNEEHREGLRQLGPTSGILVSLRAQERVIGALNLSTAESGRRYSADDVALVEELAQRAALAVENARLYRAAQEAVRAREQFLSVASHELKTPLTALLGFLELFQRRTIREGQLATREQQTLQTITLQAKRLDTLVNTLLDIARIEQGQLTIEQVKLDMNALMQRVVDGFQPILERHILTYHGPSEPVFVHGDALRLEQVVQNLLTNALKYSPDGGSITVSLSVNDAQAVLSVTDTGIGMPPVALLHLFERFYRAPNTNDRNISGMGIGLSVVKEIVGMHG